MPAKLYSLKKAEKLTRKKLIARLFDRNAYDGVVKAYPFLMTWKFEALTVHFPAQALFVVSKKFSRKATKRNRVKRQLREIYRLHKPELYGFLRERNRQIILALIYTGKQPMDFQTLDEKFSKLLQKLKNDIEQRIDPCDDGTN